jgi:hypothetical protein
MIMADKAPTTGVFRALRRSARLLVGPSVLRRPSDRLEGMIIVLLSVAFLAVAAAAPVLAERLYQSEQAAGARLHPATAVLTENGPGSSYMSSLGEAPARWRAPDGQRRSGTLTTLTAPGILAAAAGTRVRVWLSGSGQPQDPPPGGSAALAAGVIAVGMVCGDGIVVLICYWVCRAGIDRRRLAAWASDWSLTGPEWTSRL